MLTEVEFVDVQARVEAAPAAIVLGCAVKVMAGTGDAGPLTLTTVEDVVAPPGPVAVAVYVVVAAGVTLVEPVAGNVPRPLIFTEVALLAFQLRTTGEPGATAGG